MERPKRNPRLPEKLRLDFQINNEKRVNNDHSGVGSDSAADNGAQSDEFSSDDEIDNNGAWFTQGEIRTNIGENAAGGSGDGGEAVAVSGRACEEAAGESDTRGGAMGESRIAAGESGGDVGQEADRNGIDRISGAKWGQLEGTLIVDKVNEIYLEVTRWRRNIFYLPTCKAGEEFIAELARIFNHFSNGSQFEQIAFTMAAIIFPLVLQKPSQGSKTADHKRYLEKRLVMWKNGNLNDLLNEGRAIQKRFSRKKKSAPAKKEERFIKLMEKGKISAALRCIGSLETGVLEATTEVMNELKLKHPPSENADVSSLITGPIPAVESVIYEEIDANRIYDAAKKVSGAAGPSGADADLWTRLLCSKQFKKKPAELCASLAEVARKLNTKIVRPDFLRGLVAGRLIPLDKKPGVRPIGIGEVVRRIIARATTTVLKPELVDSTAPLQTCAGLKGGIEASIHAMRRIFDEPETEAILLVDASNAFNALNRKVALHNIQYTCPEFATFITNLYQCEAELFLSGTDETIYSREGTTQGGPESMGFYAVSTKPLTKPEPGVKKLFYADDGSGGGKLDELAEWWKRLNTEGPPLGYFPNAPKTWLITKPEHYERARQIFPDVNVTTEGHAFLGSFIGSSAGAQKFVDDQVKEWSKDIEALAKIAEYDPQLAYVAYTFGTSHRWQFVCRTTPNISAALEKLEELIKTRLIPAIIGKEFCTEEMRTTFRLPARLGGLGIQNPVQEADHEYECSKTATAELAKAIFEQQQRLAIDSDAEKAAMKEVVERKAARLILMQEEVKSSTTEHAQKIIELSSEKGASIWLTSLPLQEYGFRLNKQQFSDAICMRYDLRPADVPRSCACGEDYSINHCLTCKKGGYVHVRHNVVRDTVHELMTEICKDVQLEPALLPVTGESLPASANSNDGARSDVSALSFWNPMCRAFFDVRVFNPMAQTNWNRGLKATYRQQEQEKKLKYNQRILEVEKGTFTPLVFSCSGGAAPEATAFIKHLALKLSIKRRENYSASVSFIRRRIRFDILRGCTVAFRGERVDRKTKIANIEFGLQHMSSL